jgi:hypothetical protein
MQIGAGTRVEEVVAKNPGKNSGWGKERKISG